MIAGSKASKAVFSEEKQQKLIAHLPLQLSTSRNTIYFPAKSRIHEPAPRSKSLLVLFFRKEQESSFSEEKEAKRLLLSCIVFENPGPGRIVRSDQQLLELARGAARNEGFLVLFFKNAQSFFRPKEQSA